ncbi:MAG: hypothetical protein QOD52_537 [Gaiellaceae bacterium]|jgi:hypothetical protein|nr:hypothetical protein [Gaiellaceae bacterium]
MKQFATLRLAQTAANVGEQAPLATTCCSACGICVTTNVLTIVTAAVAGAGLGVGRVVRRFTLPTN